MARAPKKVEVPEIDELKELIKEINEVLNLEPAIEVKRKDTAEDLIEKIKAECAGNIYEIDFTPDEEDDTIPVFSEEAEKTFIALGIEIQPGSPPEAAEEAPAEKAPAKGKAKDKEAAAPAKEKAKAAPAAAKAKPAAKKAAEPKYSRKQAFADVVMSGVTNCDEITKKSSALYEKNGGKANTTSEGWYVAEYGQLLDCLGLATYDKKELIIFGVNDQKKGKK